MQKTQISNKNDGVDVSSWSRGQFWQQRMSPPSLFNHDCKVPSPGTSPLPSCSASRGRVSLCICTECFGKDINCLYTNAPKVMNVSRLMSNLIFSIKSLIGPFGTMRESRSVLEICSDSMVQD